MNEVAPVELYTWMTPFSLNWIRLKLMEERADEIKLTISVETGTELRFVRLPYCERFAIVRLPAWVTMVCIDAEVETPEFGEDEVSARNNPRIRIAAARTAIAIVCFDFTFLHL